MATRPAHMSTSQVSLKGLAELNTKLKPTSEKAILINRKSLSDALNTPAYRPLVIQVAKQVADAINKFKAFSGAADAADEVSPIINVAEIIGNLKENGVPLDGAKRDALLAVFSAGDLTIASSNGSGATSSLIVNLTDSAPKKHADTIAADIYKVISELPTTKTPTRQEPITKTYQDSPDFTSIPETSDPALKSYIKTTLVDIKNDLVGDVRINGSTKSLADVFTEAVAIHGGKISQEDSSASDIAPIRDFTQEMANANVDSTVVDTIVEKLRMVLYQEPQAVKETVKQARASIQNEAQTKVKSEVVTQANDIVDALKTSGVLQIAASLESGSVASREVAEADALQNLQQLAGITEVPDTSTASELSKIKSAMPDMVQFELLTTLLTSLLDAQGAREEVYADVMPRYEEALNNRVMIRAELSEVIEKKQEVISILSAKIDLLKEAKESGTAIVVSEGETPRVPTQDDITSREIERSTQEVQLNSQKLQLENTEMFLSLSPDQGIKVLLESDSHSGVSGASELLGKLGAAESTISQVVAEVEANTSPEDGLVTLAAISGSGVSGPVADISSTVNALENAIGVRSTAIAPAIQTLS